MDEARPGAVFIAGTGLIGGSIGLALKEAQPEREVVGFDVSEDAAAAAVGRGAVDRLAPSVGSGAAEAALVIVAVPTDLIVQVISEAARELGPRAVLTDTGSAKEEIVAEGERLLGPRFVGGHPMAGSEQAGIRAARTDLFNDATWVITPTALTDEAGYARVRRLATDLGARPVALSPQEHDALIARLSHLPQVVASSMVNLAAGAGDEEALLGLAAGGFRDVTRIAASEPDLWLGILRSNRHSILAAIDGLASKLSEVRSWLDEGEWAELRAFLAAARSARLDLFQKPVLVGEEPHRLAMLIPDRPGVLAEVTTAAGQSGANIEDLKIFHSPEGGRGRLELTLSGAAASNSLAARLEELGYRVDTDPMA